MATYGASLEGLGASLRSTPGRAYLWNTPAQRWRWTKDPGSVEEQDLPAWEDVLVISEAIARLGAEVARMEQDLRARGLEAG